MHPGVKYSKLRVRPSPVFLHANGRLVPFSFPYSPLLTFPSFDTSVMFATRQKSIKNAVNFINGVAYHTVHNTILPTDNL
eukprot:Pgem_evm1s8548